METGISVKVASHKEAVEAASMSEYVNFLCIAAVLQVQPQVQRHDRTRTWRVMIRSRAAPDRTYFSGTGSLKEASQPRRRCAAGA